MDFKKIEETIDQLNQNVKTFENIDFGDLTPPINVIEFNKTVENLKNKVLQNDTESPFFKSVFNTSDYYENISSYLEQTQIALDHKIKKSGVSPSANRRLHESLKLIENIVDILSVEHSNLIRKNKKSWFKSNLKIKKIGTLLKELSAVKSKIENATYLDSKVVSNVVLSEFKTIFTFFSNCIKVAKSRQDELLLVEVAGMADRIMSMIKPVFRNKSLNIEELIYYYLFYELRELKASAIGTRLV